MLCPALQFVYDDIHKRSDTQSFSSKNTFRVVFCFFSVVFLWNVTFFVTMGNNQLWEEKNKVREQDVSQGRIDKWAL